MILVVGRVCVIRVVGRVWFFCRMVTHVCMIRVVGRFLVLSQLG